MLYTKGFQSRFKVKFLLVLAFSFISLHILAVSLNLDSLDKVGSEAYFSGYYERAEDIFEQILNAHIENNDTLKQVDDLIFLAEINRAAKAFVKSLDYLKKAEDFNLKNNKDYLAYKIINRRAAVYFELEKSRKSIKLANESLGLINKLKRDEFKGIIASNYSILSAGYRVENEFDSAYLYLQKAYILAKKSDDFNELLTAVLNKGWFFVTINDLDSGLFYGFKARGLCYKYQFFGTIDNAYQLVAESYRRDGNFEKALEYTDMHIQNRDSLFKEGLTKGYFDIHDVEKNEILNKEKEVLAEKLKSQRIVQGLIIFILVLIIILFVIFYYRSRYYKELSNTIEINRIELNNTNKELQSLSLFKDKLFSVLAHDIQGPLNSIVAALELFSYDDIDNATKNMLLGKLKTQVITTQQLLVSIISWSKTQMTGVSINLSLLKLDELLKKEIRLVNQAALNKNIDIQMKGDLHLEVHSDGEIIGLIVRNLLNNAIKFTNVGGKIEVIVSQNIHNFVIQIKDNGIGMKTENINALFNRNSSNSLGTNNEKGFGLGLLLCRDFAEKLHAKISVESQLGLGSVFSLSVPI